MFTSWKIKRLTKKINVLQSHRTYNQPTDLQLKKEIEFLFTLANLCKKIKHKKKYPYADILMIECYKNAANLNDNNAHYQLGMLFLNEAKYRQQLHDAGVFTDASNLKKSIVLFNEAHAHLLAAEQLGSVQAKRLRGVAIINGWGVVANKDSGFELVVASIEQEGSWAKVPHIFASIGLNKPEFFAAIMQRKK